MYFHKVQPIRNYLSMHQILINLFQLHLKVFDHVKSNRKIRMVLHHLFLNQYKKRQRHSLTLDTKVFHVVLNQRLNVLSCTKRSNNLPQCDIHQLYFYSKGLLRARYDKVHIEASFFVPIKLNHLLQF